MLTVIDRRLAGKNKTIENRERFLRLGFHGYLSKPLQPAKLEEMILSMTSSKT